MLGNELLKAKLDKMAASLCSFPHYWSSAEENELLKLEPTLSMWLGQACWSAAIMSCLVLRCSYPYALYWSCLPRLPIGSFRSERDIKGFRLRWRLCLINKVSLALFPHPRSLPWSLLTHLCLLPTSQHQLLCTLHGVWRGREGG